MESEANMAKKKRSTLERELRRHLEENIKSRGLDAPAFRDRVEDYLFFSSRLTDMKEDMKENGITEYDRDGNLVPRKVVSEAVRISREMGKIFAELGLDAEAKSKRIPSGDDEL